ncbi:hypothetical protein PGB90_000965 [Kerria lacca]
MLFCVMSKNLPFSVKCGLDHYHGEEATHFSTSQVFSSKLPRVIWIEHLRKIPHSQ